MDFSFTDDQLMIRDLARGILEKEVTQERIREHEATVDAIDRPLWSTIAGAGLLGISVPIDLGGMGFGIAEACILLSEVGRAVAPVPVLPSIILGALPIAAFGTPAQREAWLPGLCTGETIMTAALPDGGPRPGRATTARRDGDGWRLDGTQELVAAAHIAQRILVPAPSDAGVGTFLVDPHGDGVELRRHEMSSGQPLFTVELSNARVASSDLLGERLDAMDPRWLAERAIVATCATQVGVSEKLLEMTSAYVSEREQFGVPIGTFQAVQHRLADCYIDLEAMRWVTWRAAWLLTHEDSAPRETAHDRAGDVARAVAVAKFWTAEGGSRIADAAQHLHGGIGVDVDYPVPRYFLWTKALELSLGGAATHLVALGQQMARSGPRELT